MLTVVALAAVSTLRLVGRAPCADNERTWSVYKADENSFNYLPIALAS